MVTRDETKKIPFLKEVDRQGNIKRVFIPHESRPELLTNIRDGRSYLEAGSNVTIDSSSLGPVIVSTTGSSGGAPIGASYVVISLDGTLSDERRLQAGSGLLLQDGGANGDVALVSDDSVVATISGSQFSGVTTHTAGLSGSLTQLSNGSSYLIAGDNITIVSESNGSVKISSTAAASLSKTILTASYHDLTHDPVALWQFSGSLVDETANGFDLSLQGGTERYTHMAPGMLGVQFDDNSAWYGRDATDTLLLITGSMTVEAILLVPEIPNGELFMVEVANDGETINDNALFRAATTRTFANTPLWKYFAEEGAGTNISFSTSSYAVPTGRTFHFAMTRASDTNVVSFYVDGQLAVSSSNLSTAEYGGSPAQKLNVGHTRADEDTPTVETTDRMAMASLKIISGSALDATQVREEYERSLGTLYRLE